MSRKYRYTFDFVKTEAEAVKRCEQINKGSTYYMRKKHPAHFTPWAANDGSFTGFVVWYYE